MAGLGGEMPAYDGLLDSGHPKDTEITILEEDRPTSAAPSCAAGTGGEQVAKGSSITLAAHWVVLWGFSPYFRAKLDRWNSCDDVAHESAGHHHCQQQQEDVQTNSEEQQTLQLHKKQKRSHDEGEQVQQQQQQQPAYQYSLQLLVPPGQLELGRRLITAMYSSSPDLSDLEAPQLMQLVALADCYGVGKVVTAAASQLHKLSVETMPLATAAAVFELPEACLGLEAFRGVHTTAADKLQLELGDLEVVWADTGKQQALLGLPLPALLRLLGDERTRVASEDTAVYTAGRWLEEHAGTVRRQQRQQLLGVLRLPHCTPTYLASAVAPAASWLRGAGLTEEEALGLFILPPPGTSRRTGRLKTMHSDKAAWQLPARPASSVQEVVVTWHMPLSKLEEAVRSQAMIDLTPEESVVTWCGRRWGIFTQALHSDLGLYLLLKREAAECTGAYTIQSTSGTGVSKTFINWYIQGDGVALGFSKMLDWGADKDWPQVKEWLQQQELVHPDGCLNLRIVASQVC